MIIVNGETVVVCKGPSISFERLSNELNRSSGVFKSLMDFMNFQDFQVSLREAVFLDRYVCLGIRQFY